MRPGIYEVTVYSNAEFTRASGAFEYAKSAKKFGSPEGGARKSATFSVNFQGGDGQLWATVESGGKERGADYLELKYLSPGMK